MWTQTIIPVSDWNGGCNMFFIVVKEWFFAFLLFIIVLCSPILIFSICVKGNGDFPLACLTCIFIIWTRFFILICLFCLPSFCSHNDLRHFQGFKSGLISRLKRRRIKLWLPIKVSNLGFWRKSWADISHVRWRRFKIWPCPYDLHGEHDFGLYSYSSNTKLIVISDHVLCQDSWKMHPLQL